MYSSEFVETFTDIESEELEAEAEELEISFSKYIFDQIELAEINSCDYTTIKFQISDICKRILECKGYIVYNLKDNYIDNHQIINTTFSFIYWADKPLSKNISYIKSSKANISAKGLYPPIIIYNMYIDNIFVAETGKYVSDSSSTYSCCVM